MVKPIRIAVEKYLKENRITLAIFARQVGWTIKQRGLIVGDHQRMRRTLGIKPIKQRNGVIKPQTHINYKTAVLLIRNINRDPWEFDI